MTDQSAKLDHEVEPHPHSASPQNPGDGNQGDASEHVAPEEDGAVLPVGVKVAVEDAPAAEGFAVAPEVLAQETTIPQQRPGEKPSPEEPSSTSGFWGGLQSLTITVIIALFIITFIVQAFQIPSESMENTLLIGDYLLVDKTEYGRSGIWSWLLPYGEIHRDDVIVFRYPVKPEMHFVKRVVAVPGDRVRMQSGQLFVNGALQQESFAIHKLPLPDSYRDDFPNNPRFNANIDLLWWRSMGSYIEHDELVVPPDCYFALGDNRDESLDSRYWGFVPKENIVGRPLLIYFSHVISRDAPEPPETGIGGKLARLAYTMEHLAESVRWNRAMRVIR